MAATVSATLDGIPPHRRNVTAQTSNIANQLLQLMCVLKLTYRSLQLSG